MKKSIWLAIIGAAALTGCRSEVMQQREFVPAPREDVEAAKPTPDPYATANQPEAGPVVQQRQDTAPAPQEYQPMRDNFSKEGAGDVKRGKKGGRKGGKAARGGKRGKSGKAVRGGKSAPTAGPGEYVVKPGDTPEKIARKHHVRLSDLMKANNLTEESAKRLRIGQKLVIPGASAEAAEPAKEKPAPKKEKKAEPKAEEPAVKAEDKAEAAFEQAAPAEEPKPTAEELLTNILEELKKK